MRIVKVVAAMAAVVLGLGGLQARAGTLSWTGDTLQDGLSWHRPTVNHNPGAVLALVGGGERYLVEHVVVDTTGSYALTVNATGKGVGDWASGSTQSILSFLYAGAFDPDQPLVGEIENGSCGSACGQRDWTHTLTAGTDYFVVITGYCGTGIGATSFECAPVNTQLDAGPFEASLTGPGNIAAVPEPASFALVLLALAGVVASRRKRG